jgi:hypothetical protein
LIAEFPDNAACGGGDEGDETEMLAHKAAEVNALMGEHDDVEMRTESADGVATRVAVEPTVTMATKEALAAINDMFMSELPHEATRRSRTRRRR